MMNPLLKYFSLVLLLPGCLLADLRKDMADPKLTLLEIAENELDKDRAIEVIVQDMIDIEPTQTTAIVAAAIQADSDSLDAIFTVAIDSDANSAEVVGAAILAAEAESSLKQVQYIVETAVALDPDNTRAILESAGRVSEFDVNTIAGIKEKKYVAPAPKRIPRQYDRVFVMEELPGPIPARIVDPGATMGESLGRGKPLRSLRSPR